MSSTPAALPGPLVAVSPGSGGRTPLGWADRILRAGAETLQLREKHCDDLELFRLARTIQGRLATKARLFVNGRPDIALAAGAAGVHLPANGLCTADVVASFGDELIVGRSTHNVAEVETAAREGAHYVFFGPVWATPSKAQFGPPLGPEELERAARCGIPILAIGGVTIPRLAEAAAAGAVGAAAIRLAAGEEAGEAFSEARRVFDHRHE